MKTRKLLDFIFGKIDAGQLTDREICQLDKASCVISIVAIIISIMTILWDILNLPDLVGLKSE